MSKSKVIVAIFALISMVLYGCKNTAENTDHLPGFSHGTWIDLSYPFDQNTIYWPTDTLGFQLDTVFYGSTDQNFFYSAYSYCSAEHGGTHLDAPVHFSESNKSVEQLSLDQLVGPAVVIDVSEFALNDPDYLVSVQDFTNWEKTHGQIPENVMVILYTGYGKFWPDREKYLGTILTGPEAVALLHFPGLSPEAATWLTTERNIKAIGLDTPSIDYGQSSEFESHRILFRENIPAFENLANLHQLPATGAWIIALPMPIAGGSGAPLRAIAWVRS